MYLLPDFVVWHEEGDDYGEEENFFNNIDVYFSQIGTK